MREDFEKLVFGLEKYLDSKKFATKEISTHVNDVTISIRFDSSKYTRYVGISFRLYNDDVSKLTSELFGKKIDYSIVTEALMRSSDKGKRVQLSISDFSDEIVDECLFESNRQLSEFFSKNHSTSLIYDNMRNCVERGVFKKFDLPEIYLKLSLLAYVVGKDWRHFLDEGMKVSSDVFRETLSNLERILSAKVNELR